MIGSLKRKCGTCGTKCRRDEMYKIKMKMSDGNKTVLVCEECAKKLLVSEQTLNQKLGVTDE